MDGIVAVIPARGGSKRIPRKNIKKFLGKPVLAYSIEAAQKSNLFDSIVVSTDDEEIAAIGRECGAITPFMRPSSLSDDYTGTNAVVAHAAQSLLDEGLKLSYVCCIYATAPFVLPRYIQKGFSILCDKNCDFTFSATSFPFPIQRAFSIQAHGGVKPFFEDSIAVRSQDLREAYHDAGQFYWGTPASFSSAKLYSSRSRAILLPRHFVQDIDTVEDWLRAEYMYKCLEISGEFK